jgi:hypothetical protein
LAGNGQIIIDLSFLKITRNGNDKCTFMVQAQQVIAG